MKSLTVSSLLLLATAIEALPQGQGNQGNSNNSTLNWGPCNLPDLGEDIPGECATLAVPLDYTNPSSSETLDLQLIRIRATSEPFLGSVLTNPGGPGGSGVSFIAGFGTRLVELLGGQHDIIGFDPRGSGTTIPFFCNLNWTDSLNAPDVRRRNEVFEQDLFEILNSGDWRDMGYVAETCFQDQSSTGSLLNTPFVARDMVRIVDALGEDGMLRYLGISYGTVLGQYFASMFPERVDRMVLDSVVDAPDYAAGRWVTAMRDTEAALGEFFRTCIVAGPERCALADYNGPDTTPDSLLSSFNTTLETIFTTPEINSLLDPLLQDPEFQASLEAVVFNPTTETTLFGIVKAVTFNNMYSPAGFPQFAENMRLLLSGNYTGFIDAFQAALPQRDAYNRGTEAFFGIACADAEYRASSPADMEPLVREQQETSSLADGFIMITWPCARWRMDAAERLDFAGGEFGGRTNFPILFTNGRFDPITPWASAVDAREAFEGAALLEHGGQGHGFISQESDCTNEAMRAYFVEGTLPEEGTRCEPNEQAFQMGPQSMVLPVELVL